MKSIMRQELPLNKLKIATAEQLVDKGYEVLYLIDNIDEFVVMMMRL